MVICLRGLLSIMRFLAAHSEYFFSVDTSVSLTGCVTVSYRIFHIIFRIFLQTIHVECFELEFQC